MTCRNNAGGNKKESNDECFYTKISWCNVLLMTLLAFILLLPIASAKPQDWTDKGYSFKSIQRVIPAHQETRYRTEHIRYTEKGQKRTLSYEVPYQVYVPEEIIHTSNVRLRFDVYDAKTNQAIFSRDDTRVDDYSTDLQRTYTKLVTAFYKELDKKISKG
ncbi:MAG: hypothetical protein K6F95_05735 [Selenomonas sp.]|uniref:hypothetical protein n=1 Tax=Selenomonas sp. TaxID=2053611 RepID=UPI0025F9230D|nr:hypothetical protein [Selenomonas sp.]MCR5757391.1 hypothetical protein [Selenomonas sp.]